MTDRGGILALDLATTTGFSYASPAAIEAWAGTPLEAHGRRLEGVVYGSHRLPKTGEDVGWFLDAFDLWLHDMITGLGPATCVFEAPWIGPQTSQDTARKLMNLAGHTELVCRRARLKYRECNNASVRKHFIGQGRGARADLKRQTIAMCRLRGWDPADDNAADGLALLDYSIACLAPKRRVA